MKAQDSGKNTIKIPGEHNVQSITPYQGKVDTPSMWVG